MKNTPDIKHIENRSNPSVGSVVLSQWTNFDIKVMGRRPKGKVPFKGIWYYLLYMGLAETLPTVPESLKGDICYTDKMLISLFLNIIELDDEAPESIEAKRVCASMTKWPAWSSDFVSNSRRLFGSRAESPIEFILIAFPGADQLTDNEIVSVVQETYKKTVTPDSVKGKRKKIIDTMLSQWDYRAMTTAFMEFYLSGTGKTLEIMGK